jgi:hypothetical protein
MQKPLTDEIAFGVWANTDGATVDICEIPKDHFWYGCEEISGPGFNLTGFTVGGRWLFVYDGDPKVIEAAVRRARRKGEQ